MIKKELLEILNCISGKKYRKEDISRDLSLIDDFELDSLQIIRVVVEIEDKFDIEFEDNDLDFVVLNSVNELQKCIDRYILN